MFLLTMEKKILKFSISCFSVSSTTFTQARVFMVLHSNCFWDRNEQLAEQCIRDPRYLKPCLHLALNR